VTYIGDVPRNLTLRGEWKVLKVDIEDVKCGDILFVGNVNHKKLISHVALFLEKNQIFHCSMDLGTAQVQSENTFFATYEQKLNFRKMVRYIDRRNEALRNAHGGAFILD
jgi:cell wall-associated NlpC family hydrolase